MVTDFYSGEPVTEHPAAEDIAAYLSGQLAPGASSALDAHLADCRECRRLVVSSRRLLRTHRAPSRLIWLVPPAAAAVLALVLLARVPGPDPWGGEPLRSDSAAAGSEPTIAIPIVFPAEGSMVRADAMVFVWRARAGGPLYRLSLTDAAGRELWSGETTDTILAPPARVLLEPGQTYFWTVDALTADGLSLTTRSKRFTVTP